jgi:chorismate dehydratase
MPLIYGLKKQPLPENIKTSTESLKKIAIKLREGEFELGLISTLEYALNKETWHIIPGISLTSIGKVKHVQLFFKKGLKDIQKIAVDEHASGEDVLLKIIMREKYEQSPEYVYMPANLDEMFDKAEAALIVGEKALSYYNAYPARLDLNEEWLDLTGLPFVYALWAGREITVSAQEVDLIQSSYTLGKNNLQQIAKHYAINQQENWSFYFDYIANDLNFIFSEREEDGLLEFYNYAFFYGYTEFIPDLHFFKS